MSNLLSTILAVVLLAGQPAPAEASDTVADVRKEFNQTQKELREYTAEQREEFERAAEKALADMDRRIEVLEDRIDETYVDIRDDARREWKETLRALRAKRSDLAVWYGGVKESSAEAWPRLKRGFRDAYDDVADAYHDALNRFDDKPETKDKES